MAVDAAAATQQDIARRLMVANGVMGLLGMLVFRPAAAFLAGVFLGTIVSLLNFRLLYLTLRQAVQMHPEKATRYATSRYITRYVLMGLVILVSLRSPWLHAAGTVMALMMPKLVILQRDLFNDKRYFQQIFVRKEDK